MVMVTPSRALVGALLIGIAKPVAVVIKIPTATTIRIVFTSNVHALTVVANQAPPVRLTVVMSVVRVVMGITSVVSVATKQCSCSNGTGQSGSSCSSNGSHECSSCNNGYYLSGERCYLKQCSCSNGTGQSGLPARPTVVTSVVRVIMGITLSGERCSQIMFLL